MAQSTLQAGLVTFLLLVQAALGGRHFGQQDQATKPGVLNFKVSKHFKANALLAYTRSAAKRKAATKKSPPPHPPPHPPPRPPHPPPPGPPSLTIGPPLPSDTPEVDLQGSYLGLYILKFSLGTPPQQFSGQMDVGSGIIHMPCTGCKSKSCRGLPAYNPALSSTASAAAVCGSTACDAICGPESLCNDASCSAYSCGCPAGAAASTTTCNFNITYDSGDSVDGDVYVDTVLIPGTNFQGAPVTFGCSLVASADMYSAEIPGIVGMDFQTGSLFSQLVAQNLVAEVLTVCLGNGTTEDDGFLALGAVTPTVPYATEPVVVQLLSARDMPFAAMWTDLLAVSFVGSTSKFLGYDDYEPYSTTITPVQTPALFDTGTSWLYLPPGHFYTAMAQLVTFLDASPLVASYQYMYASTDELTFVRVVTTSKATTAELDASLPAIQFTFPSGVTSGATVTLTVPASNYLVLADPGQESDAYIFLIQESLDGTATLGNVFLEHLVLQANPSKRQVTITNVQSCLDVQF